MFTFGAKYHPRKKVRSSQNQTKAQTTDNRVNHYNQEYSSQMPVFINHRNQSQYPIFSTRPVQLQQQPQVAPNFNQPIRQTDQNCSFFRVPVHQGMR